MRLDRMIAIANELDLTLDEVVAAIGRISQMEFDALNDNPSRLPLYIQSKVSPYS
jgi:hypothetical protein